MMLAVVTEPSDPRIGDEKPFESSKGGEEGSWKPNTSAYILPRLLTNVVHVLLDLGDEVPYF